MKDYTIDTVRSALFALDPDMRNTDWVRVAAGAKDGGLEFETFEEWSKGSKQGKYKGGKDCRHTWDKANKAKVVTLIYMAEQAGWHNPQKGNQQPPASARIDFAPFIAQTPAPAPVEDATQPATGPAVALDTPAPEAPKAAPAQAPKPANPVYDLLNIWERAAPATAQHPYCLAKQASDGPALDGLRVLPDADRLRLKGYSMAGALLVPVHSPDGRLLTVQCIAQVGTKPDGSPVFEKPNLKGYKFSTPDGVQGFHTVGQIEAGQPVHIVEGIGAAWACYRATGHASVVTFGVGNTKTVASTIQQHHPEARIVLVPDVGQEKAASKVAKELGCAVAIMDSRYPEARELSDNYDAWDFLQAQDPEALADLLESAQQPTKAVPLRCGGGLIPTESERQPAKYVVLDEGVEDAYGQWYKAGVWYFGIKPGNETKPDTPINMWICSPLYLEASTADAQDNSHGLLLHFKNKRGNWRDWAMPMHMLAGDCKELRAALLDMGVKVDPHNRQKLPDYLLHKDPEKELLCTLQPGWVDSRCKAFALPDGVIGPDAAGVAYQGEAKADSDFGVGGTPQGWQTGIAAMAVGNPMLALSLCAAFAGPVLAMVNAESGGPHLIGASSTGKSSLMAGAVSVWGSPAYKRGWRTTSNGLEAVAAAFNDCLLALDEISEADPKDVGATVYMLGNGQGKQRADRTGGFRRVARWRVSVLSNGERGIATSMAEGGYRIKAGQEVRVFDVPCTNRAHGVWDVLHQHPDGRALSDSIKNEAKAHYGHAGRAFVTELAAEGADLGEWLAAIRARDELSSKGEGQEQRIAGRFAVLALAGELATRYGITGWPPGEAIRACAVGLEAWRSSRTDQSGKNTEQGQIVQALTDFIDKHGDSRFGDADALPDVLQQPRPPIIHNRAGYWRNTDTGRVYLFNSAGLRDALKGFDFHRSIAYLQQAGIMGPLEGKRGQTPKQYKIQNTNSRYFEIRPDAAVGVAV